MRKTQFISTSLDIQSDTSFQIESARVFKRWVTKDVLSSVRKTRKCTLHL